MKYTHDNLDQLLLKMQSRDFVRYGNCTAEDILVDFLNYEEIADYWEIEWDAFPGLLFKEIKNGQLVLGNHLEQFIGRIIPRAERIRVLTFLRTYAQEILSDYHFSNYMAFPRECARLIYKNIQESKYDSVHGDIALMPRPNLQAISENFPLPELCKENQIIADNLPSYPRDLKVFHKSIIVCAAAELTVHFRKQAETYNRTQTESDKPSMRIQDYKLKIRDRLIVAANRYLYFDEGPIYQVLWATCVMLRMIAKPNWWEKHCAENILNYLSCTKYFSKSKIQMDYTIQQLRKLTEQTIPFEGETTEVPVSMESGVSTTPMVLNNKDMINQWADMMQERSGQPITINAYFGQADSIHFNRPVDCVSIHSGEQK
jgi:hypothetical protein